MPWFARYSCSGGGRLRPGSCDKNGGFSRATRFVKTAIILLFSKLAARRPKHTQILALAPTTTSNSGRRYLSNGDSYGLKLDGFEISWSTRRAWHQEIYGNTASKFEVVGVSPSRTRKVRAKLLASPPSARRRGRVGCAQGTGAIWGQRMSGTRGPRGPGAPCSFLDLPTY